MVLPTLLGLGYILRVAKCGKNPVKRARALAVNEVILLETYLIDGTDNHKDRYACGRLLFCTYARARWGDLLIVAGFVNDAVFIGWSELWVSRT